MLGHGSQRITRRWRDDSFHSKTRRAWDPGPTLYRVYPPKYSWLMFNPWLEGFTPARSSPSQISPSASKSLNATSEVSVRNVNARRIGFRSLWLPHATPLILREGGGIDASHASVL